MKGIMKDQVVRIKAETVEQDINILLPGDRTLVLQYRNYEGNIKGHGASLDILLPGMAVVHNWKGSNMKPAKAFSKEHPEIRLADQLAIIL